MTSSGLKMLFCGAESGSPEMLAQMNKGGTVSPDQTLALAARMRQYGVIPEFSFVLGNPPDPVADIERTLTFIRALKKVNPLTEVILYMYTPVPQAGTLYDTATDMGFRFPETLDGWIEGDWQGFSLRRDPHTPWMRPRLTRRVRDFESVLNAYYPTATDLSLTGLKRAWLKTLGAWRYHLRVYAQPLELRAFHRLAGYRRPETTGF
jgi:hypothetical protein